jgi:DNA-binding NarL/FixJ family response regulator
MSISDDGEPDDSPASIIVSNSVYERLKFIQQLATTRDEITPIRCSGELDDLIANCGSSQRCVLVVDSSTLLKAAPMQVGELLLKGHAVRVLVRVDDGDIKTLRELMMLGCFGFLTDNTTLADFKNILRAVSRGEMWVPRSLLSQMFQATLLEHSSSRLSRRECEVLSLLGQGLGNKRIAERLFISEETLRWHLRNLYAKTRVRGRDNLIKYANDFIRACLAAAEEPERAGKRGA